MPYRTGDINKLYFGVMVLDPNSNKLRQANLFGSYRVMRAVARYAIDKERIERDRRLFFIFGDTWGRFEWELWVSGAEGEGTKMSVYDMYVVPNADYLLGLVDQVSKNSARKWLKENK